MGTLIPFSLIIIALALFLGLWLGRKAKSQSLVINEKTISENNGKYKITAGTDIYYGAAQSDKCELGHDDFNVLAYSKDHGDMTDFIIEGKIDFGFMVDPSMDFHLMGKSGSEINISVTTDSACGVIVGNTDSAKSNNGVYNGNMNIENSVNFNITSTSNGLFDETCGVRFYNASANTLTINGVWIINSSKNIARGVYLSHIDGGTLNIDGVWKIAGGQGSFTFGVDFGTITNSSKITINGVWNAASSNSNAYGVGFGAETNGELNINGVWNVIGQTGAYGIYFTSKIMSGALDVNGVWNIEAKSTGSGASCGVIFNEDVNGSSIIINGVWSINSPMYADAVRFLSNITSALSLIISGSWSVLGASSAGGVWFKPLGTIAVGATLDMTLAKFFSKFKDGAENGSALSKFSSCSYHWNGILKNNSNPIADGDADSSLTLADASDTTPPNITFKIISACGSTPPKDASKSTFNGEVITALNSYATNNICPEIAKQWLEHLASNILVI